MRSLGLGFSVSDVLDGLISEDPDVIFVFLLLFRDDLLHVLIESLSPGVVHALGQELHSLVRGGAEVDRVAPSIGALQLAQHTLALIGIALKLLVGVKHSSLRPSPREQVIGLAGGIDLGLPSLADVFSHVMLSVAPGSVDRKFRVESLSRFTSFETGLILKSLVQDWHFPAASIRFAVVKGKSSLDRLGLGKSLGNGSNLIMEQLVVVRYAS